MRSHSVMAVMFAEKNPTMKKAIQYISGNFEKAITLNDVAEHIYLNPAYFSTVFKRYTGISFKKYLTILRIEESKKLLKNTDYTVTDIALMTGFEASGYFARVFKKYTGLTPRQYR